MARLSIHCALLKTITLTIGITLLPFLLMAQNCLSPEKYQQKWQAAERAIQAGNYRLAQDNYNAAKEHCKDKSDEVEKAKDALFLLVEGLRNEATKTALTGNKKWTDAFYFYDGKLTLADNGEKIGFINKEGQVIIDHKYNKADQFKYTGFAKVSRWNYGKLIDYLIDSTGREYPAAHSLEELNDKATALDLGDHFLDHFPAETLTQSQLEVLILDRNEMASSTALAIPTEIQSLKNLQVLSLRVCKLTNLP